DQPDDQDREHRRDPDHPARRLDPRLTDARRASALRADYPWPVGAPPQVFHLSLIAGGRLVDANGLRLGRVDDLIVRLGADTYPPVTGALASIAGRRVFVPAEAVAEVESGRVVVGEPRLDLQPFVRRPQEVLLKEDVLDRQLINVDGARLVRTNDIEIARLDGWYRVVGVDTSPRGFVRRLVPRRFADAIGTRT